MTPILGESVATANQMATYLLSVNKNPKFSRNISTVEFCQLFIDVCAKEGVRGDIAFVQSCKETGNFAYGGDVEYTQNNFAGLGATGNGEKGCIFSSIEEGILAQAQHLKTYATKDELNEKCVDPRRTTWFVNIKSGVAQNWEELGGVWAVPGYSTLKYSSLTEANEAKDSYGYQILAIYNNILKQNNDKKEDIDMSYKVAIDAGHGSNTAGKRCPDGYREHYINVDVANYLDIALKRCGLETLRVAWDDTNAMDDTDVSLTDRQKQIKNANCDISVSCHANAYGDGTSYNSAQGIETLIHNNTSKVGDSRNLANKVQSYLIQGTTQKNRGVKTQSLAMCNCSAMNTKASILVEVGFMTNEYEANLMKTDAFCKETAEEIAQGVCDYLGVTYVDLISTNTSSSTSTPNTSTSSNAEIYVVQSGDSLSKIGSKTGVPWKTIATLNSIKFPYVIKKGQILKLTEDATVDTSTEFKVRVTSSSLSIRSGAGTTYKKVGCITDKGTYTIIETNGNWGRLKSKVGWISISDKYVKRL